MAQQRSTASGTISFGLVAIPVKFYLTASPKNVSFNMIAPSGSRVSMKYVDSSGKEVTPAECKKGFEHTKGQYVTFTHDEFKKLECDDGGSIEIKEFVPLSSIDMIKVEKTYHLDAGKGGDKAYRLLALALKRQGRLAVAQWTNRGRQHLLVLEARDDHLVAHQMYYDNEVRDFQLNCATYVPKDSEIEMACKLMDALSSDVFDSSKYTNTFSERVQAAVEAKLSGGEDAEPVSSPMSSTSDLFEALKASLS